MKIIKRICIVLGITLGIMIAFYAIKDIYYTIEIKNKINLSEKEKSVVNETELITDIKTYMFSDGLKLKYAKMPNYSGLELKPMYIGIDYGKGYAVNKNTGEFYISTSESNIEHRHLYSANHFIISNQIIYLLITSVIIMEVVFLVIAIIKKV